MLQISCLSQIRASSFVICRKRQMSSGVVVVPQAVEDEVFAKAEAKFEKEEHLVEMLKAGKTTLEIYGFDNLIEKQKAI